MTVFVVMGVAGIGKTSLGQSLSSELHCHFQDGDDFHSAANKEKMAAGIALTDKDRESWLADIKKWIADEVSLGQSAVISCSLLKRVHRNVALSHRRNIVLIFLKGKRQLVKKRLDSRKGHFFSAQLIDTQFNVLEPPDKDEDPIIVDAKDTLEIQVRYIIAEAALRPSKHDT